MTSIYANLLELKKKLSIIREAINFNFVIIVIVFQVGDATLTKPCKALITLWLKNPQDISDKLFTVLYFLRKIIEHLLAPNICTVTSDHLVFQYAESSLVRVSNLLMSSPLYGSYSGQGFSRRNLLTRRRK